MWLEDEMVFSSINISQTYTSRYDEKEDIWERSRTVMT